MEIRLELETDSHNSYPSDKLIITEGEGIIELALEGCEREISVNRAEFIKILLALKH